MTSARRKFLARIGIQHPREWALDELDDAIRRRDDDHAELALMVSGVFGMDERWARPCQALLESDWHILHETAAFALGRVGDAAVPALVRAAREVPDYLEFDESRALAGKAIHSLGKIPGPEAEAALDDLLLHEDHALRSMVRRVLDRRHTNPPSDGAGR